MMAFPTSLDILRGGREKIATVGWCQGTFERQDANGATCGYCAQGALRASTPDFTTGSYQRAQRALQSVIGPSIVSWNDSPYRTKRQVLRALDKAIRLEEKANA